MTKDGVFYYLKMVFFIIYNDFSFFNNLVLK